MLRASAPKRNIVLRSDDMSAAVWQKVDSSISANSIAAPDGVTSADTLVEAATTAFHLLVQSPAQVGATGVLCTISIYAKPLTRSTFTMQNDVSGFGTQSARFNVTTGVVEATAGGATASIIALANGWYRCVLSTVSTGAFTTIGQKLYLQSGSYAGDGASGLYVWGAQVEVGQLSPYTPTAATTVDSARNKKR